MIHHQKLWNSLIGVYSEAKLQYREAKE
jgi:hypothetical protein